MMNYETVIFVAAAITLLGVFDLYLAWRMLKAKVKRVKRVNRQLAWVRKTNPPIRI